jgi:hypothetical protein
VVSSWYLSSLFVDHPFFTVALHEPVRSCNAFSLRRLRSTAQLNVGNRRASKGVTERYESLWRRVAEAADFLCRRTSSNPSTSTHFRSILALGEFGAPLVPFQREIAGPHSRGDIRNGQLPSKPGLNEAFDYVSASNIDPTDARSIKHLGCRSGPGPHAASHIGCVVCTAVNEDQAQQSPR